MKFFSGIIAFSFFLFSCKKTDNNSTPAPATGNEPRANSLWVYKNTKYNEAGTVTSTVDLTLKGVEVTIDGSTWLNLVNQADLKPLLALQKRTEGWWYIPLKSNPTPPPSLWFKYPATVNETYAYAFGTCTVKDINVSINVPAGEFNGCYKIDGNDRNSLEDEFWFSNGGAILVKFNTYDAKTGGPESNVYKKESLELVSFTR